MDPEVRSHGMKADPPGYLWSKYECFLMIVPWDIPHLRNKCRGYKNGMQTISNGNNVQVFVLHAILYGQNHNWTHFNLSQHFWPKIILHQLTAFNKLFYFIQLHVLLRTSNILAAVALTCAEVCTTPSHNTFNNNSWLLDDELKWKKKIVERISDQSCVFDSHTQKISL